MSMPQNAHEEKSSIGRTLVRSVGALLLGFVLVVALSLGADQILHLTKVYPPWGQPMAGSLFLLATAYRVCFGVLGSFVTAWAAPVKPMLHALIGGGIGTLLAIVGAAATWSRGPEFGPHWYPLALIVTGLPCAWLGGRLYERRRGKSEP